MTGRQIKHVGVLPDGRGITSTTKTGKTYTHVVAVQTDAGHWEVMNWCGRPDLANKAAEQQRRYMAQGWRRVAAIEIIPVSVEGGEPDER